jgi:Protein of unknown function (DUF1360)
VTSAALATVGQWSADDPRPLEGYAAILLSYSVLSGALTLGVRRKGFRAKRLGPMDLVLHALATEHLSRVITKDSVTAVLRAPVTRFQEAAGEGEVNEEVVRSGAGERLSERRLRAAPHSAATVLGL